MCLLWIGSAKEVGKAFANVSVGADTKGNTSGVAAHSRLVIFVSLRMAASAITPLSLMPLRLRLRARGKMETVREKACQWALTQKRTPAGDGKRAALGYDGGKAG